MDRKEVYEESVKAPMTALVAALNAEMMRFAPEYATDPARAIYRIYRDVRFSHDKTPYKIHIAASFWRRGTVKHQAAGYYFSVSPKEIEVGGGIYMPPPETLAAVRRHMAAEHERFRGICAAREVKRLFRRTAGRTTLAGAEGFSGRASGRGTDPLQAVPAVHDARSGAGHHAQAVPRTAARFRAMAPFVEFLNAPLAARKRRWAGLWWWRNSAGACGAGVFRQRELQRCLIPLHVMADNEMFSLTARPRP